MPRYGPNVHFDAACACINSAEEKPGGLEVKLVSPATSALTVTFNTAWCAMLEKYEAGECDYFAMQHDDVLPPLGWLDELHADLLASGADVVAAVVPIKDGRGLSSTAVDDTGNPWRPRRLTMAEVRKLPDVFTDEDVGGPLLLNTGLWICKLGPWCLAEEPDGRLKFAFGIHNEIRRSPEHGKHAPRFIPEDWDASRQFRKLGLKLAASRRLVVRHAGHATWSSADTWGWDHDRQNAPREDAKNGTHPGQHDSSPGVLSGTASG